jgi:hypothetical protein
VLRQETELWQVAGTEIEVTSEIEKGKRMDTKVMLNITVNVSGESLTDFLNLIGAIIEEYSI